MKKKKWLLLALLLMCIGSIAGCGKTEKDGKTEKAETTETTEETLQDGEYTVNVALEGGSGKASVESPTKVTVKDGKITATIIWSSPYYDYMIVDGEKYLKENEEGNSQFTIPLKELPGDLDVTADTTAMSKPHEIEYTLKFTFPESGSFEEMEKTGEMTLKYADQFQVEEYSNCKLLTIVDNGRFFIVPMGIPVPEDVPEDIEVLRTPLENVYLVSSAVMDLVCRIDALSAVTFTGTKEQDWYVQEAADAMEQGTLTYAGKYSAPDYEMLLDAGCSLAVENTMITHNPEVKEKLEELGIPVMIERSSYESHPLGRLEWIRFFGALLGKEEVADAYYEEQLSRIEPILQKENTGKKVAFFAVSSDGSITVRKPNDYVASMISLAGGVYSLEGYLPEEENALSTMKMQMEDFYAAEKDADILIYNGTIEGEIKSVDELIEKNALFADFQAVQNDQVYTTGSDFYQQTSKTCDFIEDLYHVLNGSEDGEYHFLKKI